MLCKRFAARDGNGPNAIFPFSSLTPGIDFVDRNLLALENVSLYSLRIS